MMISTDEGRSLKVVRKLRRQGPTESKTDCAEVTLVAFVYFFVCLLFVLKIEVGGEEET